MKNVVYKGKYYNIGEIVRFGLEGLILAVEGVPEYIYYNDVSIYQNGLDITDYYINLKNIKIKKDNRIFPERRSKFVNWKKQSYSNQLK